MPLPTDGMWSKQMIGRIATFGLGLAMTGLGSIIVFGALVQLGWQRHGTSPAGVDFLHLSWILDVSAPYWAAHLSNLAGLVVGVVMVLGGLIRWTCTLVHKSSASREVLDACASMRREIDCQRLPRTLRRPFRIWPRRIAFPLRALLREATALRAAPWPRMA